MNKRLQKIFAFVGLILLQALILNEFQLFGFVIPYVYIIFLILMPPHANRLQTLVLAFILGLFIDIFENTGGIHASATLVAAYFRPQLLHLTFGLSYDYQTLSLMHASFIKKLTYVALLVLIHHSVIFALEVFSIDLWQLFFEKLLLSSMFSVLLILLIMSLLKKKIR